jgi:hypothetical protein
MYYTDQSGYIFWAQVECRPVWKALPERYLVISFGRIFSSLRRRRHVVRSHSISSIKSIIRLARKRMSTLKKVLLIHVAALEII